MRLFFALKWMRHSISAGRILYKKETYRVIPAAG